MCCSERVSGLAREGVILIAWADVRYLDFAFNWLSHVRRLGMSSYMIGALDDQTLKVRSECTCT